MKKLIAIAALSVALVGCGIRSTNVTTIREGDRCQVEVHEDWRSEGDRSDRYDVPCEFEPGRVLVQTDYDIPLGD